MGFPRQEYWSGLPFPPGDFPNPGIEPASPALVGGVFTTEPPGKPNKIIKCMQRKYSELTILPLHLVCLPTHLTLKKNPNANLLLWYIIYIKQM